MKHWAIEFIGKKWVQHARGPDEFDCWGLLIWVYRKRYGVELPDVPGADLKTFFRLMNAEFKAPTVWTEVKKPFEGCGVALGGTEFYHHVGLWLDVDGGLVLHSASQKNITAQSLRGLQASGMRRFAFYKHNDANY